jgi:hypothetical protein
MKLNDVIETLEKQTTETLKNATEKLNEKTGTVKFLHLKLKTATEEIETEKTMRINLEQQLAQVSITTLF